MKIVGFFRRAECVLAALRRLHIPLQQRFVRAGCDFYHCPTYLPNHAGCDLCCCQRMLLWIALGGKRSSYLVALSCPVAHDYQLYVLLEKVVNYCSCMLGT